MVKNAVQQNYHIENLTNIPSSVGAAPIQNIEYRVQFQDIFHSLTAYNIENHTFKDTESRMPIWLSN